MLQKKVFSLTYSILLLEKPAVSATYKSLSGSILTFFNVKHSFPDQSDFLIAVERNIFYKNI